MVFSIGTRKNLNSSCPAKNPNNKTESGNSKYSKIQKFKLNQEKYCMYNVKLAMTQTFD